MNPILPISIALSLPSSLLPNKAIKRAGAAMVPQGAGGDGEAWRSVCLARRAWRTASSPGARRLPFIRGASMRKGERKRVGGRVERVFDIDIGASFPEGARTIPDHPEHPSLSTSSTIHGRCIAARRLSTALALDRVRQEPRLPFAIRSAETRHYARTRAQHFIRL